MASGAVSTSNIWPNYSQPNIAAAAKKEQSSLGKDDFLKILVTQMTNQDPTQPMSDREMISQMAQFTTVEQLTNISELLTSMQQAQSLGSSSAMIGKQITWTAGTGEASETKSGVVESIVVKKGVQYAKVGEHEIKLEDIEKIENAPEAVEPEKPENPEQPDQTEKPDQPEQPEGNTP